MGKKDKIKKIVHRACEEIMVSKDIAAKTSIAGAVDVFRAKIDIQVMARNGYLETESVKKRLMKKHSVMMNYFETVFADFISTYQYPTQLCEETEYSGCIWLCWWQGEENAPEIVKCCIDSIRRNAVGHKVIVVSLENYKSYVDIPDWVEKKRERGIISLTHFSDILRLSILARHGGMWLDATTYCTDSRVCGYFELPLWTIKRPDYAHASVACGQFANYSWACNLENRWILATIRDFLLHYWEVTDSLVDYLVLDYLIVLVQNSNPIIKKRFEEISVNNLECDTLGNSLGKAFDGGEWSALKKDTGLFKLTWKQTYPRMVNSVETYYSKVLERSLS